MNDTLLRKLETILKMRKAGNLSQWTAANHQEMSEQYSFILGSKPDYVGRWLIPEIPRRWPWRPEPAEIEEAIIARFAVKHPPAKSSFAGLVALRDLIGPYGRPREGNPCICDEGAPPLAPIEAELIADRGGWVEFCHSKTPYAIEKSQYVKDYDALLARAEAEGRKTYYFPAVEAAPPAPLLPMAPSRLLTAPAMKSVASTQQKQLVQNQFEGSRLESET